MNKALDDHIDRHCDESHHENPEQCAILHTDGDSIHLYDKHSSADPEHHGIYCSISVKPKQEGQTQWPVLDLSLLDSHLQINNKEFPLSVLPTREAWFLLTKSELHENGQTIPQYHREVINKYGSNFHQLL
jgi:hypothetical protein